MVPANSDHWWWQRFFSRSNENYPQNEVNQVRDFDLWIWNGNFYLPLNTDNFSWLKGWIIENQDAKSMQFLFADSLAPNQFDSFKGCDVWSSLIRCQLRSGSNMEVFNVGVQLRCSYSGSGRQLFSCGVSYHWIMLYTVFVTTFWHISDMHSSVRLHRQPLKNCSIFLNWPPFQFVRSSLFDRSACLLLPGDSGKTWMYLCFHRRLA